MEVKKTDSGICFEGVLTEQVSQAELVEQLREFEPGSIIHADFSGVSRGNSVGLFALVNTLAELKLTFVYQNVPLWLTEQFNMMDDLFTCGSRAESVAVSLYCPKDDTHLVKVLTVGVEIPVLENYDDFKLVYTEPSTGQIFEADFIEDELFYFISRHIDQHRR